MKKHYLMAKWNKSDNLTYYYAGNDQWDFFMQYARVYTEDERIATQIDDVSYWVELPQIPN